jgi:uncharacterized membrane protein (DUF373 family)
MDEKNQQGAFIHEELSPDEPDTLIRILNRAIRASIRVLSILMVLLILWGVVDVIYVFYQTVMAPPVLLMTVEDIFKLFGAFLVVLIAIEIFVNIRMYLGTNVVPVQLVLATALMAVARKIIVLDLKEFSAVDMLALAAVTMALGVTYWLVARLH